ncbi:MAG TPA: hypothetical protein VFR28_09635 [Allosphingosinicella sp.]|nr:hypothetical protein [Allosphingosinicella sp.]
MTTRRSRNPDPVTDPDQSTLEKKIDRIEDHVLRARQDVARLTEEIHRDVDRIREAAAELPVLRPAAPAETPTNADLQSRVAALVAAELAGPGLQAAVGRIVDARFRGLTEALQAKMHKEPNPLQGLNLDRSRHRR